MTHTTTIPDFFSSDGKARMEVDVDYDITFDARGGVENITLNRVTDSDGTHLILSDYLEQKVIADIYELKNQHLTAQAKFRLNSQCESN